MPNPRDEYMLVPGVIGQGTNRGIWKAMIYSVLRVIAFRWQNDATRRKSSNLPTSRSSLLFGGNGLKLVKVQMKPAA